MTAKSKKEVALSTDHLTAAAYELRSLCDEWKNYRGMKSEFHKSKGLCVNAAKQYEVTAGQASIALEQLLENSQQYFMMVSKGFADADARAAALISEVE